MQQRKYQRRKSRVTAAVLALFLGSVGAQKFYLRQVGIAIFMVFAVIATQGFASVFFAFFGLIDAIRLLNMSDQEFDRRYNRYASLNRRDDYMQQRKERQIDRSSRRQTRANDRSGRNIIKSNPFKNSGKKKYKDFDLDGAIDDFKKGLEISPNDVALHFNIACAYSLTEQKALAYQHLSTAVALGFKDFEMIDTKEDLAFVRIQPEFDDFKASGYQMKVGASTTRSTTPQQNQATENQEITDDVLLSQLNKLAELRKKGLLSAEEFNLERKKLMRR